MEDRKKSTVAIRLKELRKHSGLTQKQLSEKLEISPNIYAKMERGEIVFKAQLLLDMAYYLNADPKYLFTGEYSKEYIFKELPIIQSKDIKVTAKEEIILKMLRKLDTQDKDTIINVLDAIYTRKHK